MLETLHSGIMTTGVAALASPTLTTLKGTKVETNPETGQEEGTISTGAIVTSVAASITTAVVPTIQESEYHRVVNSVHEEQAVVETATDEERYAALIELNKMLDSNELLEEKAIDTLGEYGDAKKPYTK